MSTRSRYCPNPATGTGKIVWKLAGKRRRSSRRQAIAVDAAGTSQRSHPPARPSATKSRSATLVTKSQRRLLEKLIVNEPAFLKSSASERNVWRLFRRCGRPAAESEKVTGIAFPTPPRQGRAPWWCCASAAMPS